MPVPKPYPATRDRAALILAEVMGHRSPGRLAEDEVCRKWGITRRTLERHRERLRRDPELSDSVARLLAPSRERWAAKLSAAKEHALQALLDSVAAQIPGRPESLTAISDAMRTIQRASLEEASLDVWLHEQSGPPDGEQDARDTRAYVLLEENPDTGPGPTSEEGPGPDHDAPVEPAPEAGLVSDRRAAST